MAAFNYAPTPLQDTFFIPGSNTPGAGALLFIYVAGSTTKTTVYQDSAGAATHSNPIVLDAGGNLPSGSVIWIPTGVTIKAVYAPANDTDPPTSPYRTIDNIVGINDTGAAAVSEWTSGPTPTFIGATSFSLVGDQTATFSKSRRVRTTNTAGTIYSTITASSFNGTITTVTVVSDSGALDSGLSAVAYGILDPIHPSIAGGLLIVVPKTTAQNTSHVAITGMSSDVIKSYIIDISDYKPVTHSSDLYARFSQTNGSSFSNASLYSWQTYGISNTTTFGSGVLSDTALILANNIASTGTFPFKSEMTLTNFDSAVRTKAISWLADWFSAANFHNGITGVGFYQVATSAVNAMQLIPSAGNISTMTYTVYGRRTL